MKILVLKKRIFLALVLVGVYFLGFLSGRIEWSYIPTTGLLVKEMPIFYVQKKASETCLTFDISWGEKTLPMVLEVLETYQVPATFFVSGPWAVRHPDAVKMIATHGHEIASHGNRHVNLSQYPKSEVYDNIHKAHQELLSVTERVYPYFRPPNGDYDDLVIDTARELGFETIIWAIDSLDWKNPGPEYMIDRVLTKAFPGAIILCHASDSSKEIHKALPGIIKGLRGKGYKLVSLSKLMENGKAGRNDPR